MRYSGDTIASVLDLYLPLINGDSSPPSVFYTGSQSGTHLFLEHKKSVSIVPLLAHTFITFGDKVWHPGAPTNPIIEKAKDSELASPLISIKELCSLCARKFMAERFRQDESFHIICNNCQIQFGLFGDTIFVMMFIGLLISNIYTPSMAKTLMMVYLCFVLVLVNTSSVNLDTVDVFHCEHITHGVGTKILL